MNRVIRNKILSVTALATLAVFTAQVSVSADRKSVVVPAVNSINGTVPGLTTLGAIPIPADNKQTDAKVELGKLLFFDPRLGGDATISCAGCHEPSLGWAWPDQISRGYPGTVHWRNSQSIINTAYYKKLFWAASVPSLEAQAPSAAKGGVAGNGEDDIMQSRLALIPEYRKRFAQVFGDEWPLINNAWRAIASFERTLNQFDTPLDKFIEGDKKALTKEQIRGKALFEGKANCIACHSGPMATDEKFYNIGVPYSLHWDEEGLAQITFRFENYAKGVTEEKYRTVKDDMGLYFRGKIDSDKGKFRTPSLRYTKYTAPYMHNGELYTLEDVVNFYNAGGVTDDGRTTDFTKTKTPLIKPLGLTDEEKKDLVAFLEAFSGPEIEIEKPKLPEYEPLFTRKELEDIVK